MTTAKDILQFLESIVPIALKAEWDNIGLLCGRENKEVHTILVALDPFPHVCREAVEAGADLLVTHHPLIFQPLSAITDKNSVGQSIMTLIANDVPVINAHTNLDCAVGGVNDVLAEKLELTDVSVLGQEHLLRCGYYESDLPEFLSHVKQKLGCMGLRYADGETPVRKVAVGGGSCGSELPLVIASGCDTFVTADVKYNQFWEAKAMGINLIDAGHFQTENPVIAPLAKQIQNTFPEISVIISQKHKDCMKFY